MNTEKQLHLVTFEQAKALKELGFDWDCGYYYNGAVPQQKVKPNFLYADCGELLSYESFVIDNNYNRKSNNISAPTIALALKYIRDEKGIVCNIQTIDNPVGCFYFNMRDKKGRYLGGSAGEFLTYETAESALLDRVIADLKSREKNR